MKLGDGLFLNTCKRVAEQEYGHTGIAFDSMIVDNTSMQLVSKPQQFDVMVMVRPSPLVNEEVSLTFSPTCTVTSLATLVPVCPVSIKFKL
jgi:hypothetical protein